MNKFTLTLIILCFASFSLAQQNANYKPKVGLVLSGGGAKGFAHIGALKVIDSLGVKVDYVAGTSMGAVIGSLYASGYTGKQLDSIFKTVNFDDIINDKLPREAKTSYERESSEKYAVTLPFDNFQIKLPSALSRGQNTFDLLTRLMLPNCNETDFSKLPIPFFCIATDIEKGTQVILDSGNLPLAVKASSALPSLFQPVLIEDQLLIDGGVVNNYPIEELKAKGMDVIIGVDVQDGLSNRTDLSSAPEILFQINNFRTINAMKTKSKMTDVYIKPDITEFSIVSFDDGTKIIKEGEIAALKNKNELLALPKKPIQPRKSKLLLTALDSLKIKNIIIENESKFSRAYIRGKLKIKGNNKISFQEFNKGTNNLVATNNFDSFYYDFKKNDDGHDLYVKTTESKKEFYLRLAVHYDDLYKAGLLTNVTKKRLFFGNDVISLDLIFGDNIRYNFDYFLDKGDYWSIGVNSRYNEFQKNIVASALLINDELALTNVNKLNIKYSDITNQFFVQTQFRKDFPLRLGAEHKKLEINTETIISNSDPDKTTFENSNIYSAFGEISFDTFNHRYFPTKGVLFNAKGNYYVFSSAFGESFQPYTIFDGSLSYAFSPINKVAIKASSSAGLTIRGNDYPYLNFVLGGYGENFINNFKTFYGYDYLSLAGDSYIKAEANIDFEIFQKNHIILSANYANIEDDLFKTSNWLSIPSYSGYALGYSYDSFIGPIEIKYTYSPEERNQQWFFNVGFWF